MAWHVASRSALPASGLAEPLPVPLDVEYSNPLNGTKWQWWQPNQRLGQMVWPTLTAAPTSPRTLPPLVIPPTVPPQYSTPSTPATPRLREHIFSTRNFKQITMEPGELVGSLPLAAMSNPRLAFERGLKIPRTPVYDSTVYDDTWPASTSVSGYFGPAH